MFFHRLNAYGTNIEVMSVSCGNSASHGRLVMMQLDKNCYFLHAYVGQNLIPDNDKTVDIFQSQTSSSRSTVNTLLLNCLWDSILQHTLKYGYTT